MMDIKVGKVKFRNTYLLYLLFLLLQLCFSLVMKDLYVFQKASINGELTYSFNFVKFILGFFIVSIFLGSILILRIKGFLYITLVLVLIFFVFPSAILFANIKEVDFRILLSHAILFSSIFGLGMVRLQIPSQKFGILQSQKILYIIVFIGLIPFVLLYTPYLNFKNLFFQEIYQTRALMSAKVNNLYTNYTYSWFNKIIIPSLAVFGFYFRDKKVIVTALLSLVFLYLCGAHKAVFVGIFMILILYKYEYVTKANYFIKFILLVCIGSLFVSLVFNNDFLMVMSIRRTMFLPGLLDVLYYDFFDHNYLYWSQTFPGLFYEYPYEYQHYYVIGETYFDSRVWAANNGIISDGFMNFGMIGVLINSVVVGIYFSILNQLDISGKFFGVIFLFIFTLISSSLTTVLLTHGGIVLLLLAFFILRNTKHQMV